VTWTTPLVAGALGQQPPGPPQSARWAVGGRVDIGATVERHVDGAVLLDAVTIRDADRKTCAAISAELRHARHANHTASQWPVDPRGPAARAAPQSGRATGRHQARHRRHIRAERGSHLARDVRPGRRTPPWSPGSATTSTTVAPSMSCSATASR
jgi:hypothetical protein